MTGQASDPIVRGEALDQALGGYTVPDLPLDFVERVLAARDSSSTSSLPPLRRQRAWRTTRRVATGALVAGALATAAAATGVFKEIGVDLPTLQEVWTTITGAELEPSAPPSPSPRPVSEPSRSVDAEAPISIEGPIDTPEELEEAFRRIDEARKTRIDRRQDRVDRQLDEAIDRRREQELPTPTPERVETMKDRLEDARERFDNRSGQLREERREVLRDRVEEGEALGPGDVRPERRRPRRDGRWRDQLEALREMTPQERRDAIQRFRDRQDLQSQVTTEPVAPQASLPDGE
ncbi:MAG: hypothetical protein WA918_02550 [Erythrobacter sp.]